MLAYAFLTIASLCKKYNKLCCLCAAGIGGGGRGPGSISGAGGFARRLCCGCERCALVASIPGVREWSHAFALVALRAVGCCVWCSVPAASFGVSCRSWLLGALFVCSCFCIVGPRSWAGFLSWSVPFGVSCRCLHCYTFSHHFVSVTNNKLCQNSG